MWQRVEAKKKKKSMINQKSKQTKVSQLSKTQNKNIGRSTTMEERTREQTLNEIQDCEIDTQMT